MDLDNFQSRNEFLSIACIIINTRILHSCSGKSVDSSPTNFSKYFLLRWNCVIKFYPRSEDYLVAVSARKKRERKKKLLKECQNAAVPRIIPFSHFSTFNLSKGVNFATMMDRWLVVLKKKQVELEILENIVAINTTTFVQCHPILILINFGRDSIDRFFAKRSTRAFNEHREIKFRFLAWHLRSPILENLLSPLRCVISINSLCYKACWSREWEDPALKLHATEDNWIICTRPTNSSIKIDHRKIKVSLLKLRTNKYLHYRWNNSKIHRVRFNFE